MAQEINSYTYEGSELALFANANNWKAYFRNRIQRYLGQEVLEVGAGIGTTTKALLQSDLTPSRWVCLEPDSSMATILKQAINEHSIPKICEVVNDTLPTEQLEPASFDTLLYIDVLEHIDKDTTELEIAANYLRKNGYLVILSPAYDWLYTSFDKALGHYRRYSRRGIKSLKPPETSLITIESLDSVGLFASIANRLFLKQELPTLKQITFWDKIMIPASRLLDPVFARKFGRSVLVVWQKNTA